MAVKQVVFDIGGVLIEWNPRDIAERCTKETALQIKILNDILIHPDWQELDRGSFSERETVPRITARSELSEAVIHEVYDSVRESLVAIESSVQLLYGVVEQGIPCYSLSNMSGENYQYLKQTQRFFECFSGIIISGHERLIKPEPEIYRLMCQRYRLVPEETLFLDDMLVNCEAAESVGMQALHFKKGEIGDTDIKEYFQ